jgi:hypothetical protein
MCHYGPILPLGRISLSYLSLSPSYLSLSPIVIEIVGMRI